MKLPTFAEMHNDQRPTCSQQLPRPPANNNEKKNQNTTRVWHEPNHNKQQHEEIRTRGNTFNHQKTHRYGNTTLQTPKVVPEYHNKSFSEKPFEKLSSQKNLKIRLHHRYTIKNAMTQELLRKTMTNQTLARTTGLRPRPHLHQRHHETTHNTSTNTNRVPLKTTSALHGRFQLTIHRTTRTCDPSHPTQPKF